MAVPKTPTLVISCEHAVNSVPMELAGRFAGAQDVLASHRSWDTGALEAARAWAEHAGAPLIAARTSRLVCDCNRSMGHKALWSEYTRPLDAGTKAALLTEYYEPYRRAVLDAVSQGIAEYGLVLHLSIHSFTPVLHGQVRSLDVGLLYDPAKPGEKALARAWQRILRNENPGLRVRRNAPYRGTADGLPTALRRLHGPDQYLGFEIEFNQALRRFPVEHAVLALDTALQDRKLL